MVGACIKYGNIKLKILKIFGRWQINWDKMFYTKDLSKLILETSVENADEFVIISGWLGPLQIEKAVSLGMKIIALYGMSATSGVYGPTHKYLLMLSKSKKNLEIYYALPGNNVHTKCYIWKSKGKIIKALLGSANFTYNGLNMPYKEVLVTLDPEDFPDLESYINLILHRDRVEKCTEENLKTRLSSIPRTIVLDPSQIIIQKFGNEVKTIRLSLLDRYGRVAEVSGLNWGQGQVAHTTPNDAYIKIPKAAIKTEFFEPKSANQVPIDVMWDDGKAMNCFEEGNQKHNGVVYPKQIASAGKKSILGEYLRGRLGLPSGQKVKMEDLQRYGKIYIDVTVTGPKSYYLDFSKPTP